jgi:hypothetical protein
LVPLNTLVTLLTDNALVTLIALISWGTLSSCDSGRTLGSYTLSPSGSLVTLVTPISLGALHTDEHIAPTLQHPTEGLTVSNEQLPSVDGEERFSLLQNTIAPLSVSASPELSIFHHLSL